MRRGYLAYLLAVALVGCGRGASEPGAEGELAPTASPVAATTVPTTPTPVVHPIPVPTIAPQPFTPPTPPPFPTPVSTPGPVPPPQPLPTPIPRPAPSALGTVPEAGRLAFNASDGGGVWMYDAASGTTQRLPSFRGRPDADGSAFLIQSGRPGVEAPVRLDVRAGRQHELPVQVTFGFDVSADGSRVAYVAGRTLRVIDPGRPDRAVFPEFRFTSLRWSPSGRFLVLTGPLVRDDLPAGAPFQRSDFLSYELYVVDFEAKTLRQIHVSPLLGRSPYGQPSYPGIELGSWSPDERYFAIYEGLALSAALRAEPVPLLVVDVRTGASSRLGDSLHGTAWLAWRAPHTLAYVSGAGRNGWDGRRVRLWSPEDGVNEIRGLEGLSFGPWWDPSGTNLYVIRAPAGAYDAEEYYAGRGVGARRISRFDLGSETITDFASSTDRVEEAVRVARDGKHLLVVERLKGLDPRIEMWLWNVDGSERRPLVTLPVGAFTGRGPNSYADLTYWSLASYGSYSVFDSIAWSR